MKGISGIIATILLVLIAIALVGVAYVFFSGMIGGRTSKTISLLDANDNSIAISNDGTETINQGDLKIFVNSHEVTITNPQSILPHKTAVLNFLPLHFGSNLQVMVVSPSNSVRASFDIKPLYNNEGFAVKDQCGRVWWTPSYKNGTFAASVRLPDAPSPSGCCLLGAIDLSDYNHDGYLDIAVGTRGSATNGADNPTVQIAFANPDGTFQAWREVARLPVSGTCTMDYTSGGFDQDGKIDLIATGDWVPYYFLKGNGDGTFQSPVSLGYWGGGNRGADAGDFNGDGKLDFIKARCCDGLVYTRLGRGDGTFSDENYVFDAGGAPYTMATGDFDNDGKVDAVSCEGGNGRHNFYKGNGDGTFQAAQFVFVAPSGQYGAGDAFDFDHDGNLDMVFNTWCVMMTYYAKGKGDGTFNTPIVVGNFAGFDCNMAIAAPPVY